jgi:hypothetical protein
MQEELMKRILLIAMISVFLVGCGAAARESGFYEHRAIYQSWDHLWFSWYGYKNCCDKYIKESKAEAWWGIPKEYTAASCTSKGKGN